MICHFKTVSLVAQRTLHPTTPHISPQCHSQSAYIFKIISYVELYQLKKLCVPETSTLMVEGLSPLSPLSSLPFPDFLLSNSTNSCSLPNVIIVQNQSPEDHHSLLKWKCLNISPFKASTCTLHKQETEIVISHVVIFMPAVNNPSCVDMR